MESHRIIAIILSLSLGASTATWAQQVEGAGPAGGKKKKDKEVPLMDFEADVIEGKRKAPDLFLMTENQKLSPDAILFLRKDFNEYHEKDAKQRPTTAP